MDSPDVSIIVTAYNVERYIGRALQSALDQQGVTLEVIVVDDKSTDGTWSIICQHTDPRLMRLRLGSNAGPSVARNAAIAQASGAWLAVLDGDDMFLPGRLAQCLKHAAEQHADIVVDNVTIHREADNAMFPMFPPARFAAMRSIDLARFIVGNKLFSGYTLGYVKPVFSTAFLHRHRLAYDPDIRIGEDYLLLAEALAGGAHCVVEPSIGYQYTVRADSISHRISLDDIARMSQADVKFLARYRLPEAAMLAQKEREKSLRKGAAFTLLVEALKQKNPAVAVKAITSCPGCIWLLWLPAQARLGRLLSVCSKILPGKRR